MKNGEMKIDNRAWSHPHQAPVAHRFRLMYGLALASAALHTAFRGRSIAVRKLNLYLSLAVTSAGLHILFLWRALAVVPLSGLLAAGFHTLCQASISFDAVFTTVLCAVYMVATERMVGMACVAAAPAISMAGAFALFCAWRITSAGHE